jgi:hypothetical protein
MKDRTQLRERYLRDPLAVRLGGLAANLARVHSFSNRADHREAVESLLDESKYFIEWTAGDAAIGVQADLVELQLQLAQWQRKWVSIWAESTSRKAMAEGAQLWSQRVLKMSGLI